MKYILRLDRLLVIDWVSVHISGEVNDRVCVHASGRALEDQTTFNLKCREAYLDISYVTHYCQNKETKTCPFDINTSCMDINATTQCL